MTRLNQIIAIEKGVKAQTLSKITEVHQQLQKPALMAGISRTYQSKDDEGDQFPPESARVQINVNTAIRNFTELMTRLFDVTATKDWANTYAVANVVVDGKILLVDAPATYLLFLEKQLTDIHTFVGKLPVLDAADEWTWEPAADAWATEPVQTVKTKKIPRNHVKAEATHQHPAQVEVFTEDVVIGYWRTVKFSGALPAAAQRELLGRVEQLQRAVKFAREEANGTEIEDQEVGEAIFHYLFG